MLYLCSASRLRVWRGPGRLLAVEAALPRVLGDQGATHWPNLAPHLKHAQQMQGALQRYRDLHINAEQLEACFAWYRAHYEARLREATVDGLRDGDTLACTCKAPWDGHFGWQQREHPCHLELLAPWLLKSGHDVVLNGRTDYPLESERYGWPALR